jgi:hypothetical protein
MVYYLTYLKDNIGQNYLGLKIPNEIVDPYLEELKNHLGGNFDTYTENQQKRDNGHYHITVINVADYMRLCKGGMDNFINSLEPIFHYEIDDLIMKGIGMATKADNNAYFIVCESDKLGAIRTRFDLPPHDFHITLGFDPKDVFGVRKNEVMK